ncbi:MAG: hypothetical protein LBH00_06555 [Planctomycetaceae bacterium]|jgi:hypothetical protein|nr:hypothetical protein [Planctomycetaceae bacterium]
MAYAATAHNRMVCVQAKNALDVHAAVIGVAETLGDLIVAELDKTDDALTDLLTEELTRLKRWQLEGQRTPKEIYERWEKLRVKIMLVRAKGIKQAMRTYMDSMHDVVKSVAEQR